MGASETEVQGAGGCVRGLCGCPRSFVFCPPPPTPPSLSFAVPVIDGACSGSAGRAAGEIGWTKLFERYDDDGSGELDSTEFTKAVRQDCGINEHVVSDADLHEMFASVDVDGSGAVSAAEFEAFLHTSPLAQDMEFDVFAEAMYQLCDLWVKESDPVQQTSFLEQVTDRITNAVVGTDGVQRRQLLGIEPFVDEQGREQYRLTKVHMIKSFVNEATGCVEMEGVSLRDMSGANDSTDDDSTDDASDEHEDAQNATDADCGNADNVSDEAAVEEETAEAAPIEDAPDEAAREAPLLLDGASTGASSPASDLDQYQENRRLQMRQRDQAGDRQFAAGVVKAPPQLLFLELQDGVDESGEEGDPQPPPLRIRVPLPNGLEVLVEPTPSGSDAGPDSLPSVWMPPEATPRERNDAISIIARCTCVCGASLIVEVFVSLVRASHYCVAGRVAAPTGCQWSAALQAGGRGVRPRDCVLP
jgi:hypothetical protein